MAVITKHANKRAKERCGISTKSMERMTKKILEIGLNHSECTGQTKRWVDKLYLSYKKADNIRLYGDKAYLFAGKTLITIFQIPNNLLKKVRALENKKRKELNQA